MKTDRQEVQDIFRAVFQDATLTLCPEMAAKDVPSWSSFTHLNLILALEERFKIRFSSDEIAAMANVGDLFEALDRHGVAAEW